MSVSGKSSIRGIRGARIGIRSACGGMKAISSSTSGSFAPGSINSDGLGASGRIVTSSTAAAMAALAADSIEALMLPAAALAGLAATEALTESRRFSPSLSLCFSARSLGPISASRDSPRPESPGRCAKA